MKFLPFFCILTAAMAWAAPAGPDGKMLFTQNCSACHLLDQALVGPSLVEIHTLYGENPDGFVEWCNAPAKKRPEAIDMPSMAHLGEENLLAIRQYILSVSDGVAEKKVTGQDAFADQSTGPKVQRIFMPDAGPAAIAVALDATTSLCWDAGVCRLRYAWTGGFIDGYPYWKGNGGKLATVVGEVRYVESVSPFGGDTPVRFHGYDLVERLPVFRYSAGGLEVGESFKALPEGKGVQRRFTVVTHKPLALAFPANAKISITSNRGTMTQGVLKLTADEARDFTLTQTFR
jgi:cytochrome c551/c552